jgi:hypothetical protein
MPDASKAILFVGRKADKTLLAIGRLTKVDNLSYDLIITPTSETATFTVVSLTAGADPDQDTLDATWDDVINGDPPVKAPPTFITGNNAGGAPSGADTIIKQLTGTKVFPLYSIAANRPLIQASYTIGSTLTPTYDGTSPGGPYTFTGGIEPFLPGIIIAAVPPPIVPKEPRFPDGNVNWYAPAPHALSTKISITNNDNPGDTFAAETTFKIETDGSSNREGVISFCFDIPVYAITDDPMTGGGPNALTWHIRPGYGTNQYDLDDGHGSAGGSILLGVGDNITLNWIWVLTD